MVNYIHLGDTINMSQPHFGISVRVKPTLPKVGSWSLRGLPKTQSSTSGAKSPRIRVFFMTIWTSVAQVMGKRRAGSQTGNLTPDHEKPGIDLFSTFSARVRHGVGKLSTRAKTLVQTSSRSELGARSYERPKSQESKSGQFWDCTLGVPGKRAIWM
jgi:hypothetical protein